jgi:flagellar capping protein FliD
MNNEPDDIQNYLMTDMVSLQTRLRTMRDAIIVDKSKYNAEYNIINELINRVEDTLDSLEEACGI